MIKAIEMTPSEMKELFKHLPKELRRKFMAAVQELKPDSGIRYLRGFVEQYEDNDMRDHAIAHALSNTFRKIIDVTNAEAREREENKKEGMSMIELGITIIECMRHEANGIENAINKHEEDCTRGKDCGAKH